MGCFEVRWHSPASVSNYAFRYHNCRQLWVVPTAFKTRGGKRLG